MFTIAGLTWFGVLLGNIFSAIIGICIGKYLADYIDKKEKQQKDIDDLIS